jgi:adenosylmethionine-8-amino-7-oxononanoate aminotransferase
MSDLLILGTDTDAGKTTFALLWLTAFADRYEYWKPGETGDSDSQRVRSLVPAARVHEPLLRFRKAVAPLLAAREEGGFIPAASTIAAAKPSPDNPGRHLLVETFGSPLSPLNDRELQIALIQALALPTILVSSSAVGAIGRILQSLKALAAYQMQPRAVVLVGQPDPFAVEQISRHGLPDHVFSLSPPAAWDIPGITRAAQAQAAVLETIRESLAGTPLRHPVTPSPRHPLTPSPPYPFTTPPDLLERDRRCVWHPYTSLLDPDPPLVSVAAQDEFLWLADGRRVIDGISSWWTILHGHRHPTLMAALREATESFDHVHFAGVTHRPAVELAELLLSTLPWPPGGRAFFSDNGSTAVEVALKMAYQYWCHRDEPRRTVFVGFEGGYHGDTFGAMAVSRDPVFFGRFEPLLFRAEIVPLSADALHETLSRRRGEVAAVIIEPLVQGAGGMRMHTPAVLRDIAEVARRHEVLFIADEVMTGGGRTGTLWAHEAAGIVPDLICAAKTLAGGVLTLAATLAAPGVVAAWQTPDRSRTFFHGHSFTAHPVACAVAVANWKMLTGDGERGCVSAPSLGALTQPRSPLIPRQMEAFWKARLEPLRSQPRVQEVRVCGTIAAVELDVPGGYLADVGRHLRRHCEEYGVLLRPLGSVLYAMPPFCTSLASLDQIAEAMLQAVKAFR